MTVFINSNSIYIFEVIILLLNWAQSLKYA